MVFQAYNLFPHMTVLANVTLAPRLVGKADKAEAEERAMVLLRRVGLAEKALEYPDRLSGGQQQRVAVVRALANDPRLLLLDEVTSALDPELVGEVLALVGELKEQGMTIVMATHEMSFARQAADTVVFLDAGVVLRAGPARAGAGRARPSRGPVSSWPGSWTPATAERARRGCRRPAYRGLAPVKQRPRRCASGPTALCGARPW